MVIRTASVSSTVPEKATRPSIGGRPAGFLIALLAVATLTTAGCASSPEERPRLDMSLHSQRLALPVDGNGEIRLAHHPPLAGTIDLGPIVEVEGQQPEEVQAVLHNGRLHLTTSGFEHLWRISPDAGETTGAYERTSIPDGPLVEPRLARYGNADAGCVRIDQPEREPVYVTAEGEVEDACR